MERTHRPGWTAYACLALGAGLVLLAVWTLFQDAPTCAGREMDRADGCVTISQNGTRSRDFDEQLAADRRLAAFEVVGGLAILALGVAHFRTSPSGHIRKKLVLTADEAASGSARRISYLTRRPCGRCQGRGVRPNGRKCLRCRGSGLGRRTRSRVTIRTPARSADGSTVRVRGHGLPGSSSRTAGDLLLKIVIRGSRTPRRPVDTSPAASRSVHGAVEGERTRVGVDATGIAISRRTSASGAWAQAVSLPWGEIRRLGFATDHHDPVPALYAWTPTRRVHLVDVRQIPHARWPELAALIADASARRHLLDLTGPDGPHAPA